MSDSSMESKVSSGRNFLDHSLIVFVHRSYENHRYGWRWVTHADY